MDLISILFSCLLAAFVVHIIQQLKTNRLLPPGPIGLPIVGYLPFINGKKFHEDMLKLGEKYGSFFSIKLGSQNVVVCNDGPAVKAVLSKSECSARPQQFPFTYMHKGNYGLIYSTGDTWVEQRRYTLRHLRDCGMGRSGFEDQVILEVEASVKLFKELADTNEPAEFAHGVNAALFNSLWCIVSGNRFDYSDTKFIHMAEDMPEIFEELMQRTAVLTFFPWLHRILPTSLFLTPRFEELVKTVDQYSKNAVEEHKKVFNENNITDFIDMYLEEMKVEQSTNGEKTTFSEYQLQSIIGDFFYAGFETVSSTLRWGIPLLAAHPEVQLKMQEEIDRMIGRDRAPALSDKADMHYTNATIAEIQRYATIAPVALLHVADSDCEVLGYTIPKNTLILANLYASHYNTKHWRNPTKFDPERFLEDDGTFDGDKDGFVAFSAGKRQCPGEGIGRMELFHFVVAFLQHFTFELPPGVSKDIQPPENLSASRGPPDVKVIVHSRK